MKIRCIGRGSDAAEEVPYALSLGRIYVVLAVEESSLGETWYRIMTRDSETGPESVAIFSSEYFEILSSYRPSNWTRSIRKGETELSPPSWQEGGLWELFYSRGDAAAKTLDLERRVMEAEEP